MNICFLSRDYPPNLLGGVGTYTWLMAKALRAAGHKVHVITGVAGRAGTYEEEGVFVSRICPCRIPLPDYIRGRFPQTIERLEYSLAVTKELKRLVSESGIDIVESCEARFEGFFYYVFREKPALVVKLHTPERIAFELDRIPPTLDTRLKDLFEEWWMFRASKLVPVTRAVVSLVENRYRAALVGSDAEPVYYPVDTDFFCPEPVVFPGDVPLVLFAGRLEVRKGVSDLIAAIPRVLLSFPRTIFLLVGADAGLKNILQRQIAELNLDGHVLFKEQVPRLEMKKYYLSADLCVFPSLWENFAFVALEAMACGKAVVATRCGGFPEMINDGVDGLLCAPGDPADIAEKINKLLGDGQLRKTLGENARKKTVANYSFSSQSAVMTKIYSHLI